jgi:hypothetical protein
VARVFSLLWSKCSISAIVIGSDVLCCMSWRPQNHCACLWISLLHKLKVYHTTLEPDFIEFIVSDNALMHVLRPGASDGRRVHLCHGQSCSISLPVTSRNVCASLDASFMCEISIYYHNALRAKYVKFIDLDCIQWLNHKRNTSIWPVQATRNIIIALLNTYAWKISA